MQQKKKIFDITILDKDMQLRILMNIPNKERYFLEDDYQSRFSELSDIIGQENTIKLAILFHEYESIPKPLRNTKGVAVNYEGKRIFSQISRYLGQEVAETLEKASLEGEKLKYQSVIYLPCAKDLFKQVTVDDFHELIFQDWQAFTQTEEYQKERFDDGTWSAEMRPLIGWVYEASSQYNIERKQLASMIRSRFNF
jgi:hypothetical protein